MSLAVLSDGKFIYSILVPEKASLINAFMYTGNASANRALAHGIGRKPKFAFIGTINSIANYGFQHILVDGYIRSIHNTGDGISTVTAWDNTNIYVGNAGDYDASANVNLRDYYVVVFG